ncbi:MAG: helix-turn-helix transcriptional regulator [Acidimicrobiales bacterium]
MQEPEEPSAVNLWMNSGDFDAHVAGIASLAEPQRRALYRFVVGQSDPVSRDQAAAGTGVARHVAKFHLDKLVDDGLLDFGYRRPPERRGPGAGRPAKVYRRSERDISVSLPERRYEFLAQLLARAITDAERDGIPIARALQRAARKAGKALGEALRGRAHSDSRPSTLRNAAIRMLEESGFEPRRDPGGVTLANCPFHSLARDYTELACGMNLDLMKGFLAGLKGAELVARLEPHPGQCCVRLENQ